MKVYDKDTSYSENSDKMSLKIWYLTWNLKEIEISWVKMEVMERKGKESGEEFWNLAEYTSPELG